MRKQLLRKVIMWGLVAIVLLAVSFNSCERFYAKFDIEVDNQLEEIVEDIIKHETGADIDLSPESEEK